MDDANCFHMIRLKLKTSVNDMNVTVVSTVTGCDVTTVQHYKGSTSIFDNSSRIVAFVNVSEPWNWTKKLTTC